MAGYHVTIIRPGGYAHSQCFFEVAEGVCWALLELGHRVTYAENRIEPEVPTIVFGAHLLTTEELERLPASAIVYNLEQLGVWWTPGWYMGLASRVRIWDYTPVNVAKWLAVPCVEAPRLVEIGYDAHLRRIVPAERQGGALDIDVLFYGAVTERRKRVLDALKADGVRVQVAFGVYGAERDALIARSKVVLNLHAREWGAFEMVRVSYLLANGKAVVAEESVDFGGLAGAVAVCRYETAVEACKRLLRDDEERRELERRGFEIFSGRSQKEILAEVVGAG